jgi:predicted RNase H-like nuclease (RuvC/YqgF family)
MASLEKLHVKIVQWKKDHEALKVENLALKEQIEASAGAQGENPTQTEQINALKEELLEKDVEIEKIIAQVEALLT